jgi:hypothetical protein
VSYPVSALNAQPDVITRYRTFLFKAMQVDIVKVFNVNLGNGLLCGASVLTYALDFWCDGELVTKDLLTGDTVIAVFFCFLVTGQMAFVSARAAIGKLLAVTNRRSPD